MQTQELHGYRLGVLVICGFSGEDALVSAIDLDEIATCRRAAPSASPPNGYGRVEVVPMLLEPKPSCLRSDPNIHRSKYILARAQYPQVQPQKEQQGDRFVLPHNHGHNPVGSATR